MKRNLLARQKTLWRVALAFIVVTMAVPAAALFFISSQNAKQRVMNLEQTPRRLVTMTATHMAERIEQELEAIRENEAHYSFANYEQFISQKPDDARIDRRFLLNIQDTDGFSDACRDALKTQAPSPDFQWFTISHDQQMFLTAMRQSSNAVQGFVIAPTAFDNYLTIPPVPSLFFPKNSGIRADIVAELKRVPWCVGINPEKTLVEIQNQAKKLRISFMRFLTIGTIVVGVAGIMVLILLRQMDRLQQHRQRFVASAAHELRTPLTGLQMYSEMLVDNLGEAHRFPEYSRRIADESRRLTRIVSNILNLTRMERGALNVRPKLGRLDILVKDIVQRFSPAIEAAGARIELSIASNIPDLKFDPDAIGIVLQNLLDNAEKYTREARDRTIHVTLSSNPKGVLLSVADHGPGISHNFQKNLFKPFMRGDNQDAPPGLGLGLATVHMLVEAHGGTVKSENAPGGGAFFSILLPLKT